MILNCHLLKLDITHIPQEKSAVIHVFDACHHIRLARDRIMGHRDIDIGEADFRNILLCQPIQETCGGMDIAGGDIGEMNPSKSRRLRGHRIGIFIPDVSLFALRPAEIIQVERKRADDPIHHDIADPDIFNGPAASPP
ncbi:hypothetical protein D3C75_636000 [compost metagenome]